MPEIASDAGEDGGNEAKRGIVTPRRALARLRDSQSEADARVREAIERATLVSCGELGYRKVAVRDVIERYGGYRAQFYRHYSSKAAVYAAAYEAEAERLCEALLGAAAAEGSWRAGLRAALRELSSFVEAEPVLARGLLVEVHVAGGAALEKRGEVFERLSSAMDGARRETSGSRHSPPPIAAAFMVGAIEEAVCAELVTGTPERFTAAVPQLAQMVVNAFFGAEAAREELEALGTA
ncbi:MAG TPA: hypothetical protein VKG03_00960 [Solirubrobacterales bacterium]|nr:hypothetical protein [Solirubrobacterales bacterium]